MSCHYLVRIVLFCWAAFMAVPASAAESDLRQLQHKAWRAQDGAPSDINTVVQTRDGYLWVGTSGGLFRFDGVRFESVESVYQVELWSKTVGVLLASADGGLWIGYRFGGVSHLHEGKIVHYQHELKGDSHFPGAGVRALAQERDGTVWATSATVTVFKDKKWQRADPQLPRNGASGMVVDKLGGIWAALSDGIYWRPSGKTAFQKVSEHAALTFFAIAPDGKVWAVTDRAGLSRFDPATGQSLGVHKGIQRAVSSGRPMFDREGNLWCATNDFLLERVDKAALVDGAKIERSMVELFSEKDGLTGGIVTSLIQDRERNIWVSTSNGLDRFRESPIVPVPVPVEQGVLTLAMAPADDGKLWVAEWNGGLYLAGDVAEPVDPKLQHMTLMYRTRAGHLWMGNHEAFWLREGGKTRRIEWPVKSARPVPQSAAEDSQGGLWVSTAYDGIFRFYNGEWEDKTSSFKLGKPTAYAMASDAAGTVWVGYGKNTLVKTGGEVLAQYGAAQGLDIGAILVIVPAGGQVWLGGTDGMMHFDGTRFRHFLGHGKHAFKSVSGIVAAANGDLWINGDDGVTRVAAAELEKWRADPGYGVAYSKLDFLDGVVGKPKYSRPLPTALEGSDGRLWFTVGKKLMVVDPSKTVRNDVPPPVVISHVEIDDVKVPYGAPVALPPDARRIDIGFAGLSLTVPERNRYLYRLSGVDRDWRPASQRAVSYTNLAPGEYRFEVRATNNDGVWASSPGQLRFEVQPAFYQTWWFRCLAVLAFASVLWLLYRLRLKVVTDRISERLQSQQLERVRIARELHDTLLQGVSSLSLMVHSAIHKVDREHPVVPFLSDGLKHAESVIAEGRERVARLRVDVEAGDVLVDELGLLGIELTQHGKTRFILKIQGRARSLETQVAEECRAIAREAIWNAAQHANANSITLNVQFGRRMLVLSVCDDGCGLPPDVATAGCREGHWGLTGMRERALRIGGHLELRISKGTTVVLSVPASLAYRKT